MTTLENADDVVQPTEESKRAALEWLARAIPVPVYEAEEAEASRIRCNGWYLLDDDVINILPDGHPRLWSKLGWVGILAHEGIHATQYRTRRGMPLDQLRNAMVFDRETYCDAMNKEEAVAYLGTYLLSDALGFDGEPALHRAKAYLEGAPREVCEWAEAEAKRAVVWLKEHAAKVDKRPFDDDLRRWAETA